MPFSPALRRILVVTTLGSFMAFLDSTIVNVALGPLAGTMDVSLGTIQWTVTAYLLALAAALPLSSWAAARFGARRVFLVSLSAFTLASLACGLADTAGQLIAFRVAQGAAAAVATPVAQMIVVRAAGPAMMARVMSVTGVPTVLAPIVGPTIGGLLLEHVGWRWIFLVNVPLGALTVLLALRLLPADTPGRAERLDLTGFATLALGSVALTYGLARLGEHGTGGGAAYPALWAAGGALLLALFVAHALRAPRPLLDLRLHARPGFAAAALANFFLGAVIFGAIVLLPLYFQTTRGEDAVATGLLLIPQGIGVALAMGAASRLMERLGGAGRTAVAGGLLSVAATIPFVLIGADTPYWQLLLTTVVRGFGIGSMVVPIMTAAYQHVPPAAIGDATVQLNVLQRVAGSLATALLTLLLHDGTGGPVTPADSAAAFGTAFRWVLVLGACATAAALLMARIERRTPAVTPAPPAPAPPAPEPTRPAA
ncbi:DHA2 family efflux MFS transporter permease subunit [Streptomyces sp. NPDC049879]|uniref:DHA2 family efflux MFS transporter permease subunit n=1 Tax=Streptomyces sp. NPDC049879 TaxID=3365598 RepID=UPI00379582B0